MLPGIDAPHHAENQSYLTQRSPSTPYNQKKAGRSAWVKKNKVVVLRRPTPSFHAGCVMLQRLLQGNTKVASLNPEMRRVSPVALKHYAPMMIRPKFTTLTPATHPTSAREVVEDRGRDRFAGRPPDHTCFGHSLGGGCEAASCCFLGGWSWPFFSGSSLAVMALSRIGVSISLWPVPLASP